jgi:serine/threonine protein kinase/WD40 repeat protein
MNENSRPESALLASTNGQRSSGERAARLESLKQRLSTQSDSEKLRVETLLVEQPWLVDDPEAVLALLITEYHQRLSSGEEPSFQEYASRFPSHSHRLLQHFQEQSLTSLASEERVQTSTEVLANTPHSPCNVPLPEMIGCYEILEVVGRGGMGIVYRAQHAQTKQIVALKMVLAARFASPEDLLRFRLEGETVANLQHPNIVQVYEVGSHHDQPYLAFELVEGGTLGELLTARVLRPTFSHLITAEFIETLARAVHFAHLHGIVHRDLKPANILLSGTRSAEHPFGVPKITDFGLAKQLDGNSGLTESGRILGTPEYMAPEQAAGKSREIGPTTDVYTLGVILYQMLGGRTPFQSDVTLNTVLQVLSREPAPLRRINARIPQDLETICGKCLEKEQSKRYASAEELADDLRRFRSGQPILARPVGPVERAWKWARRNPTLGGLLVALVFVSLLGFSGVLVGYLTALDGWRQADTQRVIAQQKSLEAQIQHQRAETNLALSQLTQVRLDWRLGNLGSSMRTLQEIDESRRGWFWHHLSGLHHHELFRRARPGFQMVNRVAFHPDGKQLATAMSDPYVRRQIAGKWVHPATVDLWDVQSGELICTLDRDPARDGFSHPVTTLAFSPNGQFLAAGCAAGTLRIWDHRSKRRLHLFQVPNQQPIRGLCWHPEQQSIAAACQDAGALVWDLQKAEISHRFSPQHLSINDVAFTPEGHSLLALDSELLLCNLKTKAVDRRSLPESRRAVFSPNGKWLALCQETFVLVYSWPTFTLVHSLATHKGDVAEIAFSPDSQLLVSGSADTMVRVWDVPTGVERTTLRGHTGRVMTVAFHPQGAMVASGGAQPGDLRLWDITRQPEYFTVAPALEDNWVLAMRFMQKDQELTLLRRDGSCVTRDATTGRWIGQSKIPITSEWMTPSVLAMFSQDGQRLIGVPDADRTSVRVWKTDTGKELPFVGKFEAGIRLVATNEDGSIVAAGTRSKDDVHQYAVWKLSEEVKEAAMEKATRSSRIVHDAHSEGTLQGLTLNQTGKLMARAIRLKRGEGSENAGREYRVVLHDLSQRFLNPKDSILHAWPLETNNQVVALAFSPDEKTLAACERSGQVHLWQISNGEKLPFEGVVNSELGNLDSLAFSSDSRLLAGGTRTQTILWDMIARKELARVIGAPPRSWDSGITPRVEWSQDGKRLACSNWDNSISVWEGTALADLATLRNAHRDRLPTWHLHQANLALQRQDRPTLHFHLQSLENLGPLTGRWAAMRAELYGKQGKWQKAAEDYQQSLIGQTIRNCSVNDCRATALLLIQTGKWKEHQHLCEAILAAHSTDDTVEDLDSVVLACSLRPDSVRDHGKLLELAKEGYRRRLGEFALQAKKDQRPAPRFAWLLAQLRAGNHRQVLDNDPVHRSHEQPDESKSRILSYLVLAIAHHHVGAKSSANKWYDRAENWFDQEHKRMAESQLAVPLKMDWFSYLLALQLREEVRAVLRATHKTKS